MKRLLSLLLLIPTIAYAQQYSGMSGLIHVPSAEMDCAGDARIGSHFLHKASTPHVFTINNHKYNTFDAYLALTPFWWVEAAFVMTMEKGQGGGEYANSEKFLQKDRYFTIKFNPLREGKFYPAVAIGSQDIFSDKDMGVSFFCNYYVAVTKHIDVKGNSIGATLVYRKYTRDFNRRWNGVVGGISYRPSFARNWRAIIEWTGCDVNVGIDCLLWKHLLLQASLQDGKYPSAGICYKVNLF